MANYWRLTQLFTDELGDHPDRRELIKLGKDAEGRQGFLCAIPSEKPSDRFSKHSPLTRMGHNLILNDISRHLPLVGEIVRFPFALRTYKAKVDGFHVFLSVWGGVDSPFATYSIRIYATDQAVHLTLPVELSLGVQTLAIPLLQDRKPVWAEKLIIFDPAESPQPDDGGGFGDFGIFAIPNLEAHFSGEEIFPDMEMREIHTHLNKHHHNDAGLFRKPRQRVALSALGGTIPFRHPKKWISPLRPAQTGDQDSFGVWKGFEVDPISMLRLASYEAHRPCHWFEDDGSIVKAKDHPSLVIYDGKPHWSKSVSPDQLGRKKFVMRNSWENHDDQHNEEIDGSFMQAAIRNTGDPCLILEAQMMAQRWISRLTIKEGWSTSKPMAGRELGRVCKTLAYLLMVLPERDREELHAHIMKRLLVVDLQLMGQKFSEQGKVNYHRSIWNDPRVFGKGKQGWIVWEDALGATGLYMLGRMLRLEEVISYSKKLATSVSEHGTDPRTGRVFQHVLIDSAMKDGIPESWLPEVGGKGNDRVHLDTGTDFTTWALPCFKIAADAGSARAKELMEQWNYGKPKNWREARWMGI